MSFLNGEKLLKLFLEEMKKSESFSFIKGNQPFEIEFNSNRYFVYIKNISSAYFKDRLDTTRAQLPILDVFESIKNSSNEFVFLGYDSKNDVYVCWNFHSVKLRLNKKKSVSFYSSLSIQKEVKENEFLRKKLKNGDNIVLFKRSMLCNFFEKIDSFFDNGIKNKDNTKDNDSKLPKITNPELLEKLKPLLLGSSVHMLEAIKIVKEFYTDTDQSITDKDWAESIKNIEF